MRNNARDIFKRLFDKPVKAEPKTTEVKKPVEAFQPEKKQTIGWTNQHNQFQAMQANKIQKRRKANKVARKQRKVNLNK